MSDQLEAELERLVTCDKMYSTRPPRFKALEVHFQSQVQEKGSISLKGDAVAEAVLVALVDARLGTALPSTFRSLLSDPVVTTEREAFMKRMEPAHRLATQRFWATGVVQPFGASTFDFTQANPISTARNGKYVVPPADTPLSALNIDDVLALGTSKGARREDLYGCLYFYLTNQFREFGTRLRKFEIDVHFTMRLPHTLGEKIPLGETTLPPNTRFDRIDAADTHRRRRHGQIGPLPGGTVYDQPNDRFAKECTAKLFAEGKIVNPRPEGPTATVLEGQALMNTAHYRRYLEFVKMDKHTEAAGLELKERNTVVPHRILAPLGSDIDSLPVCESNEQWYNWVKLSRVQWWERYLEFSK
ncbi:hypothetical protein JCM10207_007587 [Rhodosporidiobolus poonsookiae]